MSSDKNPSAGRSATPVSLSAAYSELTAQICNVQMQLAEQQKLLTDIRSGQRHIEQHLVALGQQLNTHPAHDVGCLVTSAISAFDTLRATVLSMEAKINASLATSAATGTSAPELRLVPVVGELGQVA